MMGPFLSSGCARVHIKDREWCGDKGSQGAVCFHTLSKKKRVIPKKKWDDMRYGQICTADDKDHLGETFADQKATIEKLCSYSKTCNYEKMKETLRDMDSAGPR